MPDNIFSDSFDSELPQQIQDVITLLCQADDAIIALTADAKNIDLSVRGLDTYEKLLPLLGQVSSAYGTIRDTITQVAGAETLLNAITEQYGESVKQDILLIQQLQSQAQGFAKQIADLRDMQNAITGNKTAWQQLADDINSRQQAMNDAFSASATHIKSINALITATKRDALKSDQDMARARFDLQKQEPEQTKANAKAIYTNQAASLEQRLDAYRQYEAAQSKIAASAKDLEIAMAEDKMKQIYAKGVALQAKGKLTPELNKALGTEYNAALLEREAAYERYNVNLENIAGEAAKHIITITQSAGEQWLQNQKATLTTHLANDEQAAYTEWLHLQDRLAKGEVSYEDYGKKVAQMNLAYHQQILQDAIDSDNAALENDNLTQEQRTKLMKDSMSKQQQLMELHSAKAKSGSDKGWLQGAGGSLFTSTHPAPDAAAYTNFSEYEAAYSAYIKKKEAFETEFAQYATQLAQQTQDAIVTIQDNAYAHEAQNLDKEERTIALQNNQKIAAINATTGYAITKQNELTRANAQATAQENQIEAQKRELSIRKAKFDKAASIAGIIEGTAVAIIKAWVEAGGDPAIAIPLTALIAGIGAAQLAKAASTPIPQYAHGTGDHSGGYAIVGEAGEREWIQTPTGTGFWSKPQGTLYNLPAHTSVTPLSDMVKFAEGHLSNPGGISFTPDPKNDITARDVLQHLTDNIGRKFADTGRDIAYTILRNKPSVTININDGYKQKSLK